MDEISDITMVHVPRLHRAAMKYSPSHRWLSCLSFFAISFFALSLGAQSSDGNRMEEQQRMIDRLSAMVEAQQAEIDALRNEVMSMRNVRDEGRIEQSPDVPGQMRAWKPAGSSDRAVVSQPEVKPVLPFKFYGTVKLDAAYDDSASVAGNLTYYVLPETGNRGDEFVMTANQTQLGVNVGGKDVLPYNLMAKVEVDFYGSNAPQDRAKLRMRKAFVKWDVDEWSFLAGQDNDVFLNTVPISLDFHYYMQKGKIGYRRPQIRVSRKFETGLGIWEPAFGFTRTIGEDIDGDGRDDGATAGFPTAQWSLPVSGRWFGEKASKIAFSGHWGRESIESPVEGRSGDLPTWSVIGSWSIPFADAWSLQGSVWYGSNLDAYHGGVGHGVNPVTGRSIDAQGGWAQLAWVPVSQVTLSVGAGFDDPDDADLIPGMRSRNEMLGANVYYRLGGGLSVAFEYTWTKTSYLERDSADNNRLQSAVIYTF